MRILFLEVLVTSDLDEVSEDFSIRESEKLQVFEIAYWAHSCSEAYVEPLYERRSRLV